MNRKRGSVDFEFIVSVYFIVYCLLFAVWGAGNAAMNYRLDRDINSLIDRAQVAGDSSDMLVYLNQLEKNMKEYHLDSGHGAIFFTTPKNDFSLTYKAIEKTIERLEDIDKLPRNESTYQVALDDIRGTIREIENPGKMYVWVHYDFWAILILCIYGIPIIFYAVCFRLTTL